MSREFIKDYDNLRNDRLIGKISDDKTLFTTKIVSKLFLRKQIEMLHVTKLVMILKFTS